MVDGKLAVLQTKENVEHTFPSVTNQKHSRVSLYSETESAQPIQVTGANNNYIITYTLSFNV